MYFFLFIFCVLLWNSVQADLDIIFDDAECGYADEEFITTCSIEVNDDSEYGTTLNTHLEIIKQLPNDMRAMGALYGINMGEYTNDIGLRVDTNFCEEAKEHHSITKPFIRAIGMSGAVCPPTPGVYKIENYVIENDGDLPDSFPIGKYLVKLSLLNDERTFLKVDIYITVV